MTSGSFNHNETYFFEENLIVIESVTEENIRRAIETIISEKKISKLIPKQ